MEARKTTSRNMTQGSILGQLVLFSLPLMLGNVFQMLYNTVDSVVVGNFVGTQALAAVGSTHKTPNRVKSTARTKVAAMVVWMAV